MRSCIVIAWALLGCDSEKTEKRTHREAVPGDARSAKVSASTVAILENTSEPVKVLLWFPAVNEVKDEVRAYFADLARATGKVTIEEHHLLVDRELAELYEVAREGTVVLVRGDGAAARSEQLWLDTATDAARHATKVTNPGRPTLIDLDDAVKATLMKLLREKRKAYLTVGHGEINDPDDEHPDGRATVIASILGTLNYEVKTIGRNDGLGTRIPDDATIVLCLGPSTPLDDGELATLDAYVAGGGGLLMALDPRGDAVLGQLESRLGVHFDRTPILDDKNFIAQKGPSWAITNQFSSHTSITSLSRAASNEGVLLADSGSLDERAFHGTFVIRSMANAFRDLDGNGTFTEGAEKRDRYGIVAAVEGAPTSIYTPGFRAMVFADVDLFIDRRSQRGQQAFLETYGGPLPADAIKWIGGEEVFGP